MILLILSIDCIHYEYLGLEKWKNKDYGLILQEICLENWLKDDEKSGKTQKSAGISKMNTFLQAPNNLLQLPPTFTMFFLISY